MKAGGENWLRRMRALTLALAGGGGEKPKTKQIEGEKPGEENRP